MCSVTALDELLREREILADQDVEMLTLCHGYFPSGVVLTAPLYTQDGVRATSLQKKFKISVRQARRQSYP